MGTKRAEVYFYSVSQSKFHKFVLTEEIVLHSYCLKKYCTKLGSVESLCPGNFENPKLIVGYSSGIIIIWDIRIMKISSFIAKKEQLFSVCWGKNESLFVSSHSNGLICCWSSTKLSKSGSIHGNYSPGGLPNSILFDRNILSIMSGGTITEIIEVGSTIVDFFDVSADSSNSHIIGKNSFFLIILTEFELVSVLIRPIQKECKAPINHSYDMKQVVPFHLSPINASCVTTSFIYSVTDTLYWENLLYYFVQNSQEWPFSGGGSCNTPLIHQDKRILVLTGHEDGNVYIWNFLEKKDSPMMYRIKTSQLYVSEEWCNNECNETDISIFSRVPKKMGFYDPYCDDQRFSIQKLIICEKSYTLIVGGSAGNVLIYTLNNNSVLLKTIPDYIECNLIEKYPNFVWRGHNKLVLKNEIADSAGYILQTMLAIHPSSPISCLAYCYKWNL
ncbi:hypothetical protein MXB_1502 [Myxobolus squamalis]|nr:hypothetical protein MXB_1502 [Myxobolus squamalis]